MKKTKNRKRKFIITLTILLSVFITIGYSALSQTLILKGTASIDAMKWNVGFTDIRGYGYTTYYSSGSISSDKKSLTVICDFDEGTSSGSCGAMATVVNDSTFDVKLSNVPTVEYNDKYITASITWGTGYSEYNSSPTILAGQVIPAGESRSLFIVINKKALSEENIPETTQEIPVTITLDFVEA